MITPSFGLTATERVLPKLALDFITATLDPRVTFTRSGNTATYTNPSGVITAINANLPRFDYNPTTLVCRGLLIEEARTNLLLNSLIDGTSLTTQSVTVAATAYTLSFYGTGSIDLSGTHTATVTGTGAYPSRKTYTFTPTAGTLTLTVTGTVQYAQLEAGSFATSFIPTSASSVTRNADVAIMTGTNFSDWWNVSQGAIVFDYSYITGVTLGALGGIGQNTFATNVRINIANAARATGASYPKSVVVGTSVYGTAKMAIAMQEDNYASYVNGSLNGTSSNASMIPSPNQFNIGWDEPSDLKYMNGWMRKIFYYPQRLTNAQLAAFSK